jgi:ribosome-binding protein aMBF1 (putative translation factor)
MATRAQAQKAKPQLCKKTVRLALAGRDWSQADLANAIGRSLTSVNLTINHGMFPEVTRLIRKELKL